jgi:hypothetical protein
MEETYKWILKGETRWKGNLMFGKFIRMDIFINIENILLKQFS